MAVKPEGHRTATASDVKSARLCFDILKRNASSLWCPESSATSVLPYMFVCVQLLGDVKQLVPQSREGLSMQQYSVPNRDQDLIPL
jgi:hypothetical protein